MRCLAKVQPTGEQMKIVSKINMGTEVIRGAAGSGKTTTAILRLKSLIAIYRRERHRSGSSDPVRVLVLTYNRTLRGYISELVRDQIEQDECQIDIDVSTFGRWARGFFEQVQIASPAEIFSKIASLSADIDISNDYIVSEVEYILGRFLPNDLQSYLTARREGRGIAPRVERPTREKLINEVIPNYWEWLDRNGKSDWNQVAVNVITEEPPFTYDVVVVDEAQDFCANQLRALMSYTHARSSITFVLDTVQRIYSRGYSWREIGITVRPENSITLRVNYRNTRQIAALAAGLLEGVPVDDDSTMPDFNASQTEGEMPVIVIGKYSKQVDYALSFIKQRVDLRSQSVAFLHPKGGGWLKYLERRLDDEQLDYADLTRQTEWPEGDENVALCTLHSAKGLEFDYVFILGISDEVMPAMPDSDDDRLIQARKLLAMGIGRAKISVTLGYKEGEEAQIIEFVKDGTVSEVRV